MSVRKAQCWSNLIQLHCIYPLSYHWLQGICDSSGWCAFLWACPAQPCHLQKGLQLVTNFINKYISLPCMHHTIPFTLMFHFYFYLRKGLEFRELLFTKLINAEYACYKAEKFAKLEVSTLTVQKSQMPALFACAYASLCQMFLGQDIISGENINLLPTRHASSPSVWTVWVQN